MTEIEYVEYKRESLAIANSHLKVVGYALIDVSDILYWWKLGLEATPNLVAIVGR
jgi:hypothetical protein